MAYLLGKIGLYNYKIHCPKNSRIRYLVSTFQAQAVFRQFCSEDAEENKTDVKQKFNKN